MSLHYGKCRMVNLFLARDRNFKDFHTSWLKYACYQLIAYNISVSSCTIYLEVKQVIENVFSTTEGLQLGMKNRILRRDTGTV